MNIIVAGGGKIGVHLVKQLVAEGHDVTLVDSNSRLLEQSSQSFDIMTVQGNCASMDTLKAAGIADADLLVAVTDADEVNLLCCMTGHGLSEKLHTIARIRNPEYTQQIMTMKEVFPLSMAINPEKQAAEEIERLLRYPGFLRRDTFAKGLTEIVELRVAQGSPLCNVPLSDLQSTVKCKVLVCAVLRSGRAESPAGSFVLQEGDRIFVTAPTKELALLLKNLGMISKPVRRVILCGGGTISYYLAKALEKDSIRVQIIEKDENRCKTLAGYLPDTHIVCGDASNQEVLGEQGIDGCDAVVTLTGLDETNMVISLYAGSLGVPQVITKISRSSNISIASSMALGSVISPKELCANNIVRYVRAMGNQTGAALSVHTIADAQAEAVEFYVEEESKFCDVPLKQLKIRKGVLIAGITRGAKAMLPDGDSRFLPGDTVVAVTGARGSLRQFNDLFQ